MPTKGNPLIAFRADDDLRERLDRYIERLNDQNPGLNNTRGSVTRNFVILGLDEAEGLRKKRSEVIERRPLPPLTAPPLTVPPVAPAPAPMPVVDVPAPRPAPKPVEPVVLQPDEVVSPLAPKQRKPREVDPTKPGGDPFQRNVVEFKPTVHKLDPFTLTDDDLSRVRYTVKRLLKATPNYRGALPLHALWSELNANLGSKEHLQKRAVYTQALYALEKKGRLRLAHAPGKTPDAHAIEHPERGTLHVVEMSQTELSAFEPDEW